MCVCVGGGGGSLRKEASLVHQVYQGSSPVVAVMREPVAILLHS